MMHAYYVQKQGEYYSKMLVPIPHEFTVHEDFMFGISQEEWVKEFEKLHTMLKSIYQDICDNPSSYGLPLHEVERYPTHSKEARESLASVWRIGNLLYCLSMSSEFVCGNLYVNRSVFDMQTADMKIKNKAFIINRLMEYGFEFSNWDGNRFTKEGIEFIVSYPDSPCFLAMLKGYCARAARSLKGTKGYVNTHFYVLNYRLMKDNSNMLPDFELSDFENLIGEANTKFFREFLQHIQKYGYSICIKEDIIYKAVIINSKGKDTREFFRLTDYHYPVDELLLLRLKLSSIAQYIDKCQWPRAIKQVFSNANPCQYCKGDCAMRLSYVLDGAAKDACVCDGDVFCFFSPKTEDMSFYKALFDFERNIG